MKFRRKHYTGDDLVEYDRLISLMKKNLRQSFTLRKLLNPGWKQWGLRIACFILVNFRHGLHRAKTQLLNDRGDVPGWVLVVLMTTGLVTAIWTHSGVRSGETMGYT